MCALNSGLSIRKRVTNIVSLLTDLIQQWLEITTSHASRWRLVQIWVRSWNMQVVDWTEIKTVVDWSDLKRELGVEKSGRKLRQASCGLNWNMRVVDWTETKRVGVGKSRRAFRHLISQQEVRTVTSTTGCNLIPRVHDNPSSRWGQRYPSEC